MYVRWAPPTNKDWSRGRDERSGGGVDARSGGVEAGKEGCLPEDSL